MHQLGPGEILDRRYKIERLIGAGGMGEVYRAHRTRLGDIVAIKVIHTSGDPRARRKRFMDEARMCAMLHHPSIVSVLDFGVETGVGPYLVMEYLNGPSLKQQLAEHGAFDVADVCRIASQMANALDLAHSLGIVHRDIKPGNVMTHHYTAGEIVYKVIDFGIGGLQARTTDGSEMDEGDWTLVTLAYASPEQLSGELISSRSDIYSLGVTVYELLTGRPPFAASDSGSLITKHLRELPPPPTRYRPDIPSWAEAAVLKALEKEPQSRWPTASAFARALSGAAETRPVAFAAPSASRLSDGYEMGDLVGRGRLGSHIRKAIHRATGHQVAIRMIRRGQNADWEAARTRFMREARMTPVNHPSILRVRDYGEEKDLVYVVTDFLQGSSLREVLDRKGPFKWNSGRYLLLDLISAVRALHLHGLVAFGLTPSILRLTEDNERDRLVISSAGVTEIREVLTARSPRRNKGQRTINKETLYLAPELLINEKPDGRTDIFTIGVIGYELFTGKQPFTAKTLPQLIEAALSGKVADPRKYAPSLPAEAALCLLRCLTPRPDKRYSDVIELETAWRAIAASADSKPQARRANRPTAT
jgi:serine/threonine protein kinase